ncbi:methyltransferase domain-containing protein [Haliangium ochraceum]|uniref:Methyltransferase type 11 n=1 Tax=Haliangium ochraceum (strain DSM 14365 / JCM 11303 / SMP-2) TaxID=502025 RepID=D0LFV9_HALO1|nr:methyltransferase domain-containing protein [Haliangium ochraceum]ACY14561.1 Methyltransferase type 11 [Haliangium ochraceum DSM 14365]
MNSSEPNWNDIEGSGDADYFVGYLDTATAQSEMQRYKRRTYELLGLRPGARVLDAGCGTGDDVIELAGLVGEEGRAVGLDNSQAIVDEGRARAHRAGVAAEFHVGDIAELPFPDHAFDAVRADRVLMHIPDRERALSELVRVTRPGGRVVVREPDWDTMIVDGGDPLFARRLVHQHFDRVIRHPQAGRALFGMCQRAGLSAVHVADTSTLIITELATAHKLYGLDAAVEWMCAHEPNAAVEARAWLAQLEVADRSGSFFSAVTGFTVVGKKPGVRS